MSYASFGTSDCYMFYGIHGYQCAACRLLPDGNHFKDFVTESTEEMLIHMYDHLFAGHRVYNAIERLTEELENG